MRGRGKFPKGCQKKTTSHGMQAGLTNRGRRGCNRGGMVSTTETDQTSNISYIATPWITHIHTPVPWAEPRQLLLPGAGDRDPGFQHGGTGDRPEAGPRGCAVGPGSACLGWLTSSLSRFTWAVCTAADEQQHTVYNNFHYGHSTYISISRPIQQK